jgi:hypothetical protein
MGKWTAYNSEIIALLQGNEAMSNHLCAQTILKTTNTKDDSTDVNSLTQHIRRNRAELLDKNEGIYNATEELDVPNSKVKHLWLKNKSASLFVKNPDYRDDGEDVKEIDFLSIFKDKIEPIEVTQLDNFKYTALFDRLVITDIHIGMDVNKDGYALYAGEWNEKIIFERLEILVKHTIQNKKSDTLIIHELGDYLDGWDGYTTRGGHKLPQNMDNQQMFDIGLKFKIILVDSLINHFKKIQFVNICNDNHAGSFGYIVNSAFKSYIELKYKQGIEVVNQRRFIDHYIVENRCFILTHGKDDKSLKFGFKPILDTKQIEKIKNYIDEHKLHRFKIEFSKGDSHQLILDFTSSTSFEYQNFGAFSPPSDWVKTNFKNSISCFTYFNYYETQKSISNYIF